MCRALRRAGRGVLKGGGSTRGPEGRGAARLLRSVAWLLMEEREERMHEL